MTTNESARPGDDSGTGTKQAGGTWSQTTGTGDNRVGWHQQSEWEAAHQYAAGWADGYAAGQHALADEIGRALGVKAYSARAVIKWLIRDLDRRPEPYSGGNGTELDFAERDVLGRWAA